MPAYIARQYLIVYGKQFIIDYYFFNCGRLAFEIILPIVILPIKIIILALFWRIFVVFSIKTVSKNTISYVVIKIQCEV